MKLTKQNKTKTKKPNQPTKKNSPLEHRPKKKKNNSASGSNKKGKRSNNFAETIKNTDELNKRSEN